MVALLAALYFACYAGGIAGWAGAVVLLSRRWRRTRGGGAQGAGAGGGRTQLVLLGALAANDLVALCGMLALLCSSRALSTPPEPRAPTTPPEPRALCVARVLLRVFGMGSACIGMAMALDRYLALTRPFFYQKKVTGRVVAWAVGAWWAVGGALTLLPLAGAGRYYKEGAKGGCRRYRDPVAPHHLAYALSYITFGSGVCVVLVWCNVRVICALCSTAQLPVRRCSGRTALHPQQNPRPGMALVAPTPMATPQELAFTRLMATLSVLTIVCWLPQMVTAALCVWRAVQSGAASGAADASDAGEAAEGWFRTLSYASDLLLLGNYTLDPYLYVVARRRRLRLPRLFCRLLPIRRTPPPPPCPARARALELAPLQPACTPRADTHTSLSFVDS